MNVKVLALASALLCALTAEAQQSIDQASISGRVTDPFGAVVAGARVTARSLQTNVATEGVTGTDGRFRFPYLRVGVYEIVAVHEGFRPTAERLVLSAGAAFELPITLSVAGLDATVTVSGDTRMIEAARSQIAGTVSLSEVRSLPLNGRNFLEVALLIPGVAPAAIASTQLFPETSAVPGISLSINGQRNLSNSFIVDGLSANDDAAGLSGMTYGLDAIDQVQVVTSGGQAELGRALGGYVNVVTRSGTNALAATGYGFLRDDRLNADNALSPTRLPMRQSQYGASLGGPMVANRTFYFANVEQRRLDQTGLTTISPANAALVNARLAATGYRAPLVDTGLYPNPLDSTNLLFKLDHHVSGRHHLGVRYSQYGVDATNARGAGGLNAPSAAQGLDNLDQAIAVSNVFALSPRTVLESRAQVARGHLESPPADQIGPAVSIAGVATFGRLSSSPAARRNTTLQAATTVSHQAGAHAFRIGIDVLHNDDTIDFPRAKAGMYVFGSLANFLAGVYNNAGFTQTFGETGVSLANPNLGVYAQDEWKVAAGVTVNLGLRYELQWLDTIAVDADNVAPRLGLTWSPLASRRTLVRAGAGLYYDRIPLRALANALLSAGNTTTLVNLRQTTVTLSPGQAGAPAFPAVLSGIVASAARPTLTTMDRGIDNAYSRQASVEVEQQLDERTTLAVGYQYARGADLLMSINQNVPTCLPSGANNGCRPIADYGNDNRYSSAGSSSYHGMHVSVARRPARWGQYRVSYTLSRAENNVGEFFFSSPIDPFDVSKDWGRADGDERHRLVMHGSVSTSTAPAARRWQRLTGNFELSGLLQASSARPFNITSGLTTVHATPARPVVDGAFIARNAGVGSPSFNVSARIMRTFRVGSRMRLEATAEVFNLTNHVNAVTRNTNFGPGAYPDDPAPGFGQLTAVGEPRSVQVGLRIRF